jgi:hypothetical protein
VSPAASSWILPTSVREARRARACTSLQSNTSASRFCRSARPTSARSPRRPLSGLARIAGAASATASAFCSVDQLRSGAPRPNRRSELTQLTKQASRSDPIGADRDPTLGPISYEISTRCGEICPGPVSMLIHRRLQQADLSRRRCAGSSATDFTSRGAH